MTVNNKFTDFIKDLDYLAALAPLSSEYSKRYLTKDKKGDLGVSKGEVLVFKSNSYVRVSLEELTKLVDNVSRYEEPFESKYIQIAEDAIRGLESLEGRIKKRADGNFIMRIYLNVFGYTDKYKAAITKIDNAIGVLQYKVQTAKMLALSKEINGLREKVENLVRRKEELITAIERKYTYNPDLSTMEAEKKDKIGQQDEAIAKAELLLENKLNELKNLK